MKKLVVAVGLAAAFAVPGFAWDVEHDEVAQLTGEFLPGEIRRFFSFDDFGVLFANCHYPDGVEGENRYRTLEETAAIVGAADAKLLAEQGFKVSGWLHRERGRAVAMGLLAKAFAERNPQPKVTGTSFAAAARRGNVVWLSEYLLMPFVWSEDTTLDWNAMRFDSFAAEILMDAMK